MRAEPAHKRARLRRARSASHDAHGTDAEYTTQGPASPESEAPSAPAEADDARRSEADHVGGAERHAASSTWARQAPQRHASGFMPGSIVRIACGNFLTYDQVEFHPGPYLNMIIGPNGTGKSTVVCAIALGLGWKPSVLGRAKDVGAYVKYGHDSGWIEIELQGHATNTTIRRVIMRESGTSDWMLDGKYASAKEVGDAVAQYHIEVGNLCSFLPQDRVAEFARMPPPRLLQETQRIAGHPQLIEWHLDLIERGHALADMQRALDHDREEHDNLLQRNQVLERDVRRYEERAELERRVTDLELRLPFARYRDAKQRYTDAREQREEAKGALAQAKEALRPAEHERRRLAEQNDQLEEDIRSHRSAADKAVVSSRRLLRQREQFDEQIALLGEQEKHLEERAARRRADIAALKERIAALESEIRSAPEPPDTSKLELRLRNIKAEQRTNAEELQDLEAQHSELRTQERTLAARKADAEKSIEQLANVRHRRLAILERGDNDTYKAVLWLRANRQVFQRTVHEPVLVELGIKEPSAARAIETCLSWPIQRTFVCECRADYDMFTRELIDRKGWRLNVVELEGGKPLEAYTPPIPPEQLRQLGFETYAIDLVDAATDVLRYLCSAAALHSIPIARGRVDPSAVESVRSLRRYIVGDTVFTVNFSNYGRRLAQTMSRELKPLRNFAQSVDPAAVERANRVLHEVLEELEALRQRMRECVDAQDRKNRERSDLQQRRDEAAASLLELQKVHADAKKREVQLQNEKNKLAYEEGQPSLSAQRADISRKRKQTVVGMAKVALELRDTLRTLLETRAAEDEATLQGLQLSSEHARAERVYAELKSGFREAEHALEQVLEKFAEAKQEALRCKRHADAQLQAAAPDALERLRDHIETDSASSDELEMQLASARAALDIPTAVGAGVVETFRERLARIESLRAAIDAGAVRVAEAQQDISRIEARWLPELEKVIAHVNSRFGAAFQRMRCAGEVRLARDDSYDKWGIDIYVKFRDTEQLQLLTGQRQSGGERSLSTIMYLLSLTELARAPFSLVDEINQGMDPRAERAVHNQLVEVTCRQDAGQCVTFFNMADQSRYFLITPKLLANLRYDALMRVLIINNGEWLPQRLRLSDYVRRWLYLFSIVVAAVLLFVMVFYIIMYSDLESDYINPIDLCTKLNQFTLPEMGLHAFLTLLFLINGQWTALIVNVPLVAYNVNKVINNTYLLDATEIFRTLMSHKKEGLFKLGFYLLSFFFYLYNPGLSL
ncbi:Structural maintenance of chromosomes protein 5 [Malassezia cuniculi]|uniref:Structural maintenance of chromosomes protein 5 n=1 Tax=Malassezia cuniculi TaxID=948313 RepID=A0AAF0J7I6_9BASI|nr:Structural maintenance of chromosomes protein 5 [Malassezia cuniculi]